MRGQQINRISGKVVIVLSLTALLTVLSGYTQPPQPPEPDEGTAAHIFQLSIVALVPMMFLEARLLPGAPIPEVPWALVQTAPLGLRWRWRLLSVHFQGWRVGQ